MRVLITGARAPVALDHARRFAAQGHTVFAADSHSHRLTASSRAVTRSFRLPPPRTAIAAFAGTLAGIIERERIDLVLPTCEEVFYVSRARSRLPAACNVFAAPFELLAELHSKLRFTEIARDCGVHVPATTRVRSLAAARALTTGPIVLKPEFSRFGVHVRIYRDGIPADAPELPALGDWAAQELVAGRELCSFSIAVRGELRAHVTYEPAYRLARSSSFFFDPVENAAIRGFVATFVRKTTFTGQISFDWIESAAGRVSVLECNPRAISGLHLFAPDAALPAAIAGDSTGGACDVRADAAPRMISAVMTSAGLAQALRRGTFARWRRDYRRARDVLATPGDRSPLAGGLLDMAVFAASALRRRSSVREAATRDIEWDGEVLAP